MSPRRTTAYLPSTLTGVALPFGRAILITAAAPPTIPKLVPVVSATLTLTWLGTLESLARRSLILPQTPCPLWPPRSRAVGRFQGWGRLLPQPEKIAPFRGPSRRTGF